LLLGPSIAKVLAIKLIGDLNTLAYSRDEESQADATGSDICAATSYNPWGLVWLFEEFQNADPKQIPHETFKVRCCSYCGWFKCCHGPLALTRCHSSAS
jgi:hypothetical protein